MSFHLASRLLIAAVASLTLPAWGQETGMNPGDDSGGTPAIPTCVTLVTSPEQPKAKRNRVVFSATEILDVEFHVLLPRRLDGDHQVELKVYTPRGHLYQSLTVPFSSQVETPPDDGSRPGRPPEPKLRAVPAFPYPLEEQGSVPVRYRGRRYALVTARLPVAGTSITNSSLYGRWSVETYLDESAVPCCPRRNFTISE